MLSRSQLTTYTTKKSSGDLQRYTHEYSTLAAWEQGDSSGKHCNPDSARSASVKVVGSGSSQSDQIGGGGGDQSKLLTQSQRILTRSSFFGPSG